jgi:hypothetical protein
MGGASSVELNYKIENSSEDTIVVSKLEARALLEEIQRLQSKCGEAPNQAAAPAITSNIAEKSGTEKGIFFSYALQNSSSAAAENANVEASVGITDPRDIIYRLKDAGNVPVNADFLMGHQRFPSSAASKSMMNSRAMVAFISNEFSADEDCVDQFEYAKKTLRIPIISVIVGNSWNQGWEWQKSNIGLLIAGDLYIDMTDSNTVGDKFTELSGRIHEVINGKSEGVGKSDENFPIFLSYCWSNSKDAEDHKEVGSAVGSADPRAIQSGLQTSGLSTWLDKEQLGRNGLFEDIAEGLLGASVVVACISDEYARSENCGLEFMYSQKTLRLPIVPVVVGVGEEWKKSKIGLLLSGAEPIFCTSADGVTVDKHMEIQRRVRSILQNGNEYVPDTDNLKVGDHLELHYPNNGSGDLDYRRKFNQDPKAIVDLDDEAAGKYWLCSAYWWPVRVVQVDSPTQVKVEWMSYEGSWDQYADVTTMRPTQLANSGSAPLRVGSAVEVKLAQKKAYAWAKGVVEEFRSDGRVQVKITNPQTGLREGNSHAPHCIERVRVKRGCIFVCSSGEQ